MKGPTLAAEIMVKKLVTLSPQMDVFDAIDLLLRQRISGAPVIDENRLFVGVFSEKCCMRVLVDAAYDQLPSTEVVAYMDADAQTITEEADLLTIAQIFLNTDSRRLPVLRDGRLVGQISRRDLLSAAHRLNAVTRSQDSALLYLSSLVDRQEAPIAR
ncbi:MAG: CBS domain-containing protein [Planctomycetes bacterium]|nr:CBS domain-containing protein [Planctomycetota bacterium]